MAKIKWQRHETYKAVCHGHAKRYDEREDELHDGKVANITSFTVGDTVDDSAPVLWYNSL